MVEFRWDLRDRFGIGDYSRAQLQTGVLFPPPMHPSLPLFGSPYIVTSLVHMTFDWRGMGMVTLRNGARAESK